jgi:propionaldehyde dehydrogenase
MSVNTDSLSELGMDQDIVSLVTKKVMEHINKTSAASLDSGNEGIFESVDEAVSAAKAAQIELNQITLEHRGKLIEAIRTAVSVNAERLSHMELDETGFGRYEDKVAKHMITIQKTPGLEDIQAEVLSGDNGLTVTERRPYGVAGCILPSTAPSCTAIHNSICMIAAGNSAVISPHPGGKNVAIEAIRLINRAIAQAKGPRNLIVTVREASMEKATEIMHHPDIDIIVATGGPGVVKATLSSGKKGIGAGPGNPPVLVDETADIIKAAKDIIDGNSFENCIQCIGEKECLVVECVADLLISEMQQNGAYLITDPDDIRKLTELVTKSGMPNIKYVGKDPGIILRDAGINPGRAVRTIIYEVPADHITVMKEYLMPLLPIVRVPDVDEGISLAAKIEGHCRHTAVIHSRDVHNITKYAKAIQTTILVKNGPSYSGVGFYGEGHVSMTLAATGEGITSPRSFTRPQRCAMIGELNLRSAIR